jgi:hypothetical protein
MLRFCVEMRVRLGNADLPFFGLTAEDFWERRYDSDTARRPGTASGTYDSESGL